MAQHIVKLEDNKTEVMAERASGSRKSKSKPLKVGCVPQQTDRCSEQTNRRKQGAGKERAV